MPALGQLCLGSLDVVSAIVVQAIPCDLLDVGGDDEKALVVLRTGTLCQHHDYNVEPHVG